VTRQVISFDILPGNATTTGDRKTPITLMADRYVAVFDIRNLRLIEKGFKCHL